MVYCCRHIRGKAFFLKGFIGRKRYAVVTSWHTSTTLYGFGMVLSWQPPKSGMLMEEIRPITWDVLKKPVNNKINYQPQLVQAFFHQQYVYPSKIEWDRIPTDPYKKVTIELSNTQVFLGSVGPTVGDFLESIIIWWNLKYFHVGFRDVFPPLSFPTAMGRSVIGIPASTWQFVDVFFLVGKAPWFLAYIPCISLCIYIYIPWEWYIGCFQK